MSWMIWWKFNFGGHIDFGSLTLCDQEYYSKAILYFGSTYVFNLAAAEDPHEINYEAKNEIDKMITLNGAYCIKTPESMLS